MTIRNFYFFFSANKMGKSGLTDVTVDVYAASDGSKVEDDQAATEIAGGLYKYSYSTTTADDFLAVGKTADATVDMKEVPALYKNLLQNLDVAISTRATLGAGAFPWNYTLTAGGLPIANALVWVTTDSVGANVVASGLTNAFGVVSFKLNAGTYFIWRKKAGVDFSDPDIEVVP